MRSCPIIFLLQYEPSFATKVNGYNSNVYDTNRIESFSWSNIAMTRKRDKIWTAIIATKQWFAKLFTSEADALVNDFDNNPPPEIGTQSYSGDIHAKGD